MNNADGIKKPRKRKNQISGFLYILPALFIALLFSYRPFVKTIINSLSIVNYSGTIIDVAGLDNFKRLFADRNFLTSLTNTFRFAVMFVPLNLLVCIILALLVYRKRKGTAFNESLFIMPLSVAMSSAAIVFQALFNPTIGVINFLFNVQVQWFNDPKWAMWVIVILCIWMAMGLDFLLLVGALRSIPKEVLEAAELDGSNRLQTFFHIQIPLISPTLMFVIANRLRDSMLLSGPVLVMTEGGPFRSTQTLVYQMYVEGFKSGNYSMGSAISVIVFLLSLAMIAVSFRFERKGVFYQ
ncbi:MAG: sugar ABC transporter permease [Sphaerochaetaceae bacterium]|jgi:sn-glycerol 3-phosphate transport system permease protein|nr:sugar ABC transporter permease [Sphaerochaetaceae bacterium]NLO61440.1 sugar ABC transporter permease [Spirochaetales bacterium]MDD2405483.1 sugar ABC transporter permease [Sphaerochaetaceae bacterium]MDD3670439.1 sugar ABC transporter permease [Sphaerochaetaceae bacterium]MDD4258570.1 sugar ABC transporter permease [Sphaerochaetaceae bacterium]